MSNNLINFNSNQIKVRPGDVEFNGFKKLKQEALQLSEQINQVEVTDENVKASKKMLAAVNNRVKEIESKRIAVKKELLEPYTIFESQVKEVVSIVKDADSTVRHQVRELEELERSEKESSITDLFHKRMQQYPNLVEVYEADDFIDSKHLNKSTSMKSVETDMVTWLEKKDSDLTVIKSLPNSHDVLMEYLDTIDLSVAMNIVNQRDERMKELETKVTPTKEYGQKEWIITISDEKDYKLVEMFMKQNNIDYNLQK